MKKKLLISALLLLALGLLTAPPFAVAGGENENGIIVSANRRPVPRESVASSHTVITEAEIRSSQRKNLADLLRTVPGLDVVRSGSFGGNTSVFIRGANPEHTLVILDGVRLNNPSSTGRAFNFANLSLDNIERIEVIRGPQSTLYGSDAIGGVISITTKQGSGEPTVTASLEGGSFGTFQAQSILSGGDERFSYSLGVDQLTTDGISAAERRDGNTERDGYENSSYSMRLGVSPFDEATWDIIYRHIDSRSDLDNSGGVGGDDLNRELTNRDDYFRTQLEVDPFDSLFLSRVGVSVNQQKFRDDNDPDENSNAFQRSRFKGRSVQWDWQNTLFFGDSNSVVFGLETAKEDASSNLLSDGDFGPFESSFGSVSARTNSAFLESLIVPVHGLSTSLGVRVDDHSEFGSEVTFRAAPSYVVGDSGLRLFATVGTGFKAPSLFQLYSDFGSLELEAEKSLGMDVGVEYTFFDNRAVWSLVYFHNTIRSLIDFDSQTFLYNNINRARIQGVESSLGFEVTEDLSVFLDGSYTRPKDRETGLDLLRRARTHGALRAVWVGLDDQLSLQPRVSFVGSRDDNDFSQFPAERVSLGSHAIVDFLADYELSDQVALYARVENLFDKHYQEVLGFGTPGVAGYGGIRVKL